MITDPYAVLGVPRTATKEEIKKAYRAKAKQYHPDLHPNDPVAAEKMNEVNQAYDMINNPEKYKQTSGYNPYGQSSTYSGSSTGSSSYGTSGDSSERRYTYNTYGDQNPWVMFDDLFRSFEEQARQSQQRDNEYRSQQEQDPNYTRRTYRSRGCLSTIFRILLFWLLIRFLLRSCGTIVYYGPQTFNQQYDQQYEQQYEQYQDNGGWDNTYHEFPGNYPGDNT